jgi:5,10-methylenetetrahydrofolate reductase
MSKPFRYFNCSLEVKRVAGSNASPVLSGRCAQIAVIHRGVADPHFYTMNRADLVFAVCHLVG